MKTSRGFSSGSSLASRFRQSQGFGWAGIKNGKLLRLAETEFDVFVTADKNLSHQQPLTTFDLGIVVLRARTTKLEDLLPLVAAIREVLLSVAAGQVSHIGSP